MNVASLASLVVLCGSHAGFSSDNAGFTDNKFTDGHYFSAIYEREHYLIVPYIYSSYTRDNWLVCWQIDSLKVGSVNLPEKTYFLMSLPNPLSVGLDFRATEPRNLILREDYDSKQIGLYAITNTRQVSLVRALKHVDLDTNRPWFTRSEDYFFLRDPGPAIYASSNLSICTDLRDATNLLTFHSVKGWVPEVLTDDLKYLIKPIWRNFDDAGLDHCDVICCYNIVDDELQTFTVHSGTNQASILSAESYGGGIKILALFLPERLPSGEVMYRHLGVFNAQSSLISEIVVSFTDRSSFIAKSVWDYAHSRVFFYDDNILTEYDYGGNQVKRFPLSIGNPKVP